MDGSASASSSATTMETRCVAPPIPAPMLADEIQHGFVEGRREFPQEGVAALGGREFRAGNQTVEFLRQVHRDQDVLGAGQHQWSAP